MTSSQLINAVETADSSDALLDAVEALAAACLPEAIPTLIEVLGFNNPGAAVAAVDGLITIGEPAVMPILEQLDGYNYGARAWAVRALSGIGDPRGLDILLDAAGSDFALSVRRAAARGLGAIRWHELPSEAQSQGQKRAFETLSQACQDPEWIVRYGAVVGLQGLQTATAKQQPEWWTSGIECLETMIQQDEVLAVQARAKLALSCLLD
ncbi:MAG: HEAT repeat domain-containing protein [Microcoleaceae cyanobacterium]